MPRPCAPVDDSLLQQIGQPHVGLDEVEAELGALAHLQSDLRAAVERRAARVVDARAVERLAREEHTRSDPHAGVDGSRSSIASKRFAAGFRTVVMPKASQMRPSASP